MITTLESQMAVETLPTQFSDALTAIEVTGRKRDRVIAAHKEIRELLEADEQLCSLGVDTILIGSYARHTGVYPGKDVDVFVKLTKLDTSADPGAVFAAVKRVLAAKSGKRAEPQRRAVTVSFGDDGFSVDAVPAVKLGTRWALPNHDPGKWGNPDERWIETDPEKMTTLTEQRNKSPKVGDRGAYVPTVKLMRQTRRQQLGDNKPGRLYFEILTYWAFKNGTISGASFAEIFASVLRAAATQLAANEPLLNPVLGTPYDPAPEDADRRPPHGGCHVRPAGHEGREGADGRQVRGSGAVARDHRQERPRRVLRAAGRLRRDRQSDRLDRQRERARITRGAWLRMRSTRSTRRHWTTSESS